MWKKSLSLTLAALFGCAALGLAATPAVMPATAIKPLPVQTSQTVDAVASASIPDEEVTPETPKDTQKTKEKDKIAKSWRFASNSWISFSFSIKAALCTALKRIRSAATTAC